MAQSPRQKRTVGRVMHEFKHGELKRSAGGKGGKVKNPRQAVAIALSESGSSNRQSPRRNAGNERRTERKEAKGETAQQAREGKDKVGAQGQRKKRRSDSFTRQELYARARRKGVEGRSRMNKAQLKSALGLE